MSDLGADLKWLGYNPNISLIHDFCLCFSIEMYTICVVSGHKIGLQVFLLRVVGSARVFYLLTCFLVFVSSFLDSVSVVLLSVALDLVFLQFF